MADAKPQILLAEDEENIAFSLGFILERAGYDVVTTSDGGRVLQMVRATRPEAIILDIMLPNKSGFEVLEEIRGSKDLCAIPILVLSAKGQARDVERATSLGASAYMTKPFSNAEVVKAVGGIIDAKKHKLD